MGRTVQVRQLKSQQHMTIEHIAGYAGYDNQILPSIAIPMFMSVTLMACESESTYVSAQLFT